ncbi:hypothetical protein FZC76_08410 [Sutcliffiella horikoshii]|uniref:Uncharacterized protein n=1 Tax=Sutcliffiella horikoshii TaxID=79883 RepID=A0A5D4T212_9BACI|nr:hypothetical protein FZC76_08410 [Sutcliffiella horikoshii]
MTGTISSGYSSAQATVSSRRCAEEEFCGRFIASSFAILSC